MNNLWQKSNYLNKDITYLSNVKIYEYDMKSGGFSILKEKGFFSEKEINYLEKVDKRTRNVYIGKKLQKNTPWNKILIDGFKEAVRRFFEEFQIEEENVLSIKKDAIFLININLGERVELDGYITFELNKSYTSFYNLNDVEFYYNKDEIDVKGINDEIVNEHVDYFLGDLCDIFEIVERNNRKLTFDFLRQYRSDYINRELPHQHYKEFNRRNEYLYKVTPTKCYYVPSIDEKDIDTININYNYNFYLKPLISYLI